MNWEAVGAIGEIFGAVAVLATLVYLAKQIRHKYMQVEQGLLDRGTLVVETSNMMCIKRAQ